MKPKFSFIIPSLNEGKYIGDCLKSIKQQTRKDFEIIVVDSYSKDATVKTAKSYGARVFYEGRKGPGVARNTGAKHARGEIFVFPDADVRFEKDFLEKLSKKYEKNIGGGIFFLVPHDAPDATTFLSYNFANSIAKFLISMGIVMTAGSCFSYTKKIFKKAGGFDPRLLTNEDHDLADRAARLSRFCFFDDIHVFTSTRRVNSKGFLTMCIIYFKSSVTFFLNRSYVRDYWK